MIARIVVSFLIWGGLSYAAFVWPFDLAFKEEGAGFTITGLRSVFLLGIGWLLFLALFWVLRCFFRKLFRKKTQEQYLIELYSFYTTQNWHHVHKILPRLKMPHLKTMLVYLARKREYGWEQAQKQLPFVEKKPSWWIIENVRLCLQKNDVLALLNQLREKESSFWITGDLRHRVVKFLLKEGRLKDVEKFLNSGGRFYKRDPSFLKTLSLLSFAQAKGADCDPVERGILLNKALSEDPQNVELFLAAFRESLVHHPKKALGLLNNFWQKNPHESLILPTWEIYKEAPLATTLKAFSNFQNPSTRPLTFWMLMGLLSLEAQEEKSFWEVIRALSPEKPAWVLLLVNRALERCVFDRERLQRTLQDCTENLVPFLKENKE